LTDAAATGAPSTAENAALSVAILADDLIWSTRLADAVRAAGGRPRVMQRLEDLAAGWPGAVIVDLTARAYDGVTAVGAAAKAGARVVAVGQHDDATLRRAAMEAGASRVFTYRALFEDGPRLLGRWLAG
jgi:DNA-binding NarL/FixJ family response regulator